MGLGVIGVGLTHARGLGVGLDVVVVVRVPAQQRGGRVEVVPGRINRRCFRGLVRCVRGRVWGLGYLGRLNSYAWRPNPNAIIYKQTKKWQTRERTWPPLTRALPPPWRGPCPPGPSPGCSSSPHALVPRNRCRRYRSRRRSWGWWRRRGFWLVGRKEGEDLCVCGWGFSTYMYIYMWTV